MGDEPRWAARTGGRSVVDGDNVNVNSQERSSSLYGSSSGFALDAARDLLSDLSVRPSEKRASRPSSSPRYAASSEPVSAARLQQRSGSHSSALPQRWAGVIDAPSPRTIAGAATGMFDVRPEVRVEHPFVRGKATAAAAEIKANAVLRAKAQSQPTLAQKSPIRPAMKSDADVPNGGTLWAQTKPLSLVGTRPYRLFTYGVAAVRRFVAYVLALSFVVRLMAIANGLYTAFATVGDWIISFADA